jgi:GTP 3',8-cyclase
MSYKVHMRGYNDLRTLYQTDSLYAWTHNLFFPPVMVEISPTHSCNQRCRSCYSNNSFESPEMLREDVLVDAFRQVADAGVKAVLVQGTGEPLMHKATPAAIEAGAKRNLSIGLTTNGVLFNKPSQDRILEHLLYARFSVVESDPKRYAYLHGCPEKQWEILVKNIESAVAQREKRGLSIALWATMYLYEENFRDAHNIVKFYKDLGIDYVVVQEATYTEFSPAGKRDEVSKNYTESEINELKQKIRAMNDEDFVAKIRFPINDDSYFVGMNKDCWKSDFCQGVHFYTIISSDGEIYPCWRLWGKKDYSYGSLYEKRFEEIWRGDRRTKMTELVNKTPPSGDECSVCNIVKLNEILHKYRNANTNWKDFLI